MWFGFSGFNFVECFAFQVLRRDCKTTGRAKRVNGKENLGKSSKLGEILQFHNQKNGHLNRDGRSSNCIKLLNYFALAGNVKTLSPCAFET